MNFEIDSACWLRPCTDARSGGRYRQRMKRLLEIYALTGICWLCGTDRPSHCRKKTSAPVSKKILSPTRHRLSRFFFRDNFMNGCRSCFTHGDIQLLWPAAENNPFLNSCISPCTTYRENFGADPVRWRRLFCRQHMKNNLLIGISFSASFLRALPHLSFNAELVAKEANNEHCRSTNLSRCGCPVTRRSCDDFSRARRYQRRLWRDWLRRPHYCVAENRWDKYSMKSFAIVSNTLSAGRKLQTAAANAHGTPLLPPL